GDDYELCFTVPDIETDNLEKTFKSTNCGYTKIGRITGGKKINYCQDGKKVDLQMAGYLHFRSESEND
ncbi:MAG: thiamine-phosphate kinase, partial [Gammaproteobacteria bacterium]|nr:thiamine-phosphate kinase [Gammaproteobacteria bacterium]